MIIIEKDTMCIKYYEKIIKLENSHIEIQMPDNIIKILGKALNVSYYTSDEVVVHGILSTIYFR
jgi:hypothetical protein